MSRWSNIGGDISVTNKRAIELCERIAKATGRPVSVVAALAILRGCAVIERDLSITDPDRKPISDEEQSP